MNNWPPTELSDPRGAGYILVPTHSDSVKSAWGYSADDENCTVWETRERAEDFRVQTCAQPFLWRVIAKP